MNILITGGLGYIGGRVARFLKDKVPATTIYLATNTQREYTPDWAHDCMIVSCDVCHCDAIEKCLAGKDIDCIIHLAALNEIDSIENPMLATQVNVEGTRKLLKYASQFGVKKCIYFSTFHVYDKKETGVICENTPTHSVHPYAVTHREAEDVVNYYRDYHRMQTAICRLSNSYGYPMHADVNRWSLVFNDLCRQAVTSDKIILKSSGRQHRDFISLYDVSRAVYHLLFTIPDSWGDGLYNLAGECSMAIIEVAEKIAEIYKETYGKEFDGIKIAQQSEEEHMFLPINISVEKLKRSGFILKGCMELEIKRTLDLCQYFIDIEY